MVLEHATEYPLEVPAWYICQEETVQVGPIEWTLCPMLAVYSLSAFMMSELKRGDTRDAGVIGHSDLDVSGM